MLRIALIFFSLLSSAHAFDRSDLKTGDVLLQSLPCYLCSLIEIEEESAYSHTGVILKDSSGTYVLESWITIKKIPIEQYLSIRRKNTKTLVMRPIDQNGNEIYFRNRKVSRVFNRYFSGLNYDEAFSWSNADSKGELLYCSEFVAKFLDRFIPTPIPTKPMHFDQYREDWIKYFKGTPPDGQPGISPADLERSPLLKRIGEI